MDLKNTSKKISTQKNELSELKNTLKPATEVGCAVPEDSDAETFAYFDNDLIISEKLSVSKIIASVI